MTATPFPSIPASSSSTSPTIPTCPACSRHLGVPTHASDMTFAASIRDGWLEWGARDLDAVIGQRRNLLRPRFGLLVRDVLQIQRPGAGHGGAPSRAEPGRPDPQAGAGRLVSPLLSAAHVGRDLELPALRDDALSRRAPWCASSPTIICCPSPASRNGAPSPAGRRNMSPPDRALRPPHPHQLRRGGGDARSDGKVQIKDTPGRRRDLRPGGDGQPWRRDAGAAEGCRSRASGRRCRAFRYQKNLAVLHRDQSLMPRRRRCWASWVYTSDGDFLHPKITVTYWMNRLQGIDERYPLFVSLNPKREIPDDWCSTAAEFDHPVFDAGRHRRPGADRRPAGPPRHLVRRRPSGPWLPRGRPGQRRAGGARRWAPPFPGTPTPPDAPQQKPRRPV